MDPSNIRLVDNTAPAERQPDDAAASFSRTTTKGTWTSRSSPGLWSRPSIRGELTKRKYAKWQPERLGCADNTALNQTSSSDGAQLSACDTNASTNTNVSAIGGDIDGIDARLASIPSRSEPEQDTGERNDRITSIAATTTTTTNHQAKDHPKICGLKAGNDLDILYENQRGWFFFGIPLYSQRSLLNFDPAAWMTPDWRPSLVNITNAQVPDPSWEWVWRAWYVDMSGDVDEQGWQYAFSFKSSAWHGTHPFGHSFVRRRRWVRLRVKRMADKAQTRAQTPYQMSHRLNEDYFTIHSAGVRRRAASVSDAVSRATSAYLSRVASKVGEDATPEEICNIPSLMYALRLSIVDREKLDAVKKFIAEGAEELYYLDEKIPEIMSRLVYQASRWQLLTHLKSVIHELSQPMTAETTSREVEGIHRKQDNLVRAARTARLHLGGPEVFHGELPIQAPKSAAEMLNLTPGSNINSLLSRYSGKFEFKPMDNGGEIKGIPKEAEVGLEGHIY